MPSLLMYNMGFLDAFSGVIILYFFIYYTHYTLLKVYIFSSIYKKIISSFNFISSLANTEPFVKKLIIINKWIVHT